MISRTVAGPVAKSEDKYCLRCHSSEGRKSFINGETISTQVNAAEILGSPHKDIGCSDCHSSFSTVDHPITGSGPSGNTGMPQRRYVGDAITTSIRRWPKAYITRCLAWDGWMHPPVSTAMEHMHFVARGEQIVYCKEMR